MKKMEPAGTFTGQLTKFVAPTDMKRRDNGQVITTKDGSVLKKGYLVLKGNYNEFVIEVVCTSNPESQTYLSPFVNNPDWGIGCQLEVGFKPYGEARADKFGGYYPNTAQAMPGFIQMKRTPAQMAALGLTVNQTQQPADAQGYNNPVQGVGNPFPQTAPQSQPSSTASMF